MKALLARFAAHLRGTSLATRVAVGLVAAVMLYAYGPYLGHPGQLGLHDWDQMEAHRYLVQRSLLHYHQFPFWNPYACGGFTAWGGLESDSVVVTPWLPAYLILSLSAAIRVEIVGSAILSAAGAWLLAARFVRSPALRALVTILWVVNVRHFLQVSVGHTWHLSYAWVPWGLFFYDRAAKQFAPRDIAAGAIAIALMAYNGAIYPLPQVALVIVVYAIGRTAITRSFRPILAAAAQGLLGMALAAPKLLPTLEALRRFPRLIQSNEMFPLPILHDALVERAGQDDPYRYVAREMWHEWGMYVGLPVVVWLVWGALASSGRRAALLKWIALFLAAIALGAFGSLSPWVLLHKLPLFSSQHEPMRWLYLALLPAALAAAVGTELWAGRLRRVAHLVEAALLLCAVFVSIDIAPIAQRIAQRTFVHAPTDITPAYGAITTFHKIPPGIPYEPGAYNSASLPAEQLGISTVDCDMFPGLTTPPRVTAHPPGLGARATDDPQYRGEVWVDGAGTAEISTFSPNEIDVALHGASGRVYINQNWDPGWRADGDYVDNQDDLVSAPIASPDATIRFTYRPHAWWRTIAIFLAGLAAIALLCAGRLRGKVVYCARCLVRRTK